jgi:ferrous iron transport protein B
MSGILSLKNENSRNDFGYQFDKIALHPFFGYVLMFFVLLVVFEAIFKFSEYPMELIDGGMGSSIDYLNSILPDGILKRLLLEGILAGIQGIVIFIPQIAILFALIGLMEESGYMARVMVLLDRFMNRFGLSGKAVIPLVSGVACAVPAIMSTRNMSNSRERLIAIFVTPLMSCSARLPVFTLLIAMLIPGEAAFGPFSLQGLSLFGLYLIGLGGAIGTAFILDKWLEGGSKSSFLIEIPPYQKPHWRNLWLTVFQKSKTFVVEAGKVILAISIILWFMAGFGPGDSIEESREIAIAQSKALNLSEDETSRNLASKQLEASYAGIAGRWIEPALRPLGFDWKIGVALITSFAAREVFVGTMSILYASGTEGETEQLKIRMEEAVHPESGTKVFTPAVISSLLVFYIFAMQCMSTLAVSYRETGSWKWPMLQLVYMTGLAALMSFLVFNLLK